mgnify:FL=1
MSIFEDLLHEDTWHKDEPNDTWDDDQAQNMSNDEDKNDDNVNESTFDSIFNESDDGSGFDGFGVDKIDRPSKSGLVTGVDAATKFANATDGGLDCSIDLSYHNAFGESDNSGFEKDASLVMEDGSESIPVDPTTIPHHDLEDDQYSDSLDEPEVDGASPAELAADDDSSFGESATGWDDLY